MTSPFKKALGFLELTISENSAIELLNLLIVSFIISFSECTNARFKLELISNPF